MAKKRKNKKTCRTFRFNKRAIEDLPPNDRNSPSTEVEYTDTECRGLKVSVSKNGNKYFIHRYAVKKGRKRIRRCYRIGFFPALTVADARAVVTENNRNLMMFSIDPQEEKYSKSNELTFAEFFEKKYMEDHAKLYKKSWKDDQQKYDLDIKDEFGDRLLSEIKKHDIVRFLNKIKKRSSGASANRYLSLLSKVFSTSLDWEFLTGDNPCSRIKKFKETIGRERFLIPEEVKRMKAALDRAPQRVSALLIWFLLTSGCRLGEASRLTWEYVEIEKKVAYLSKNMTKNGYGRPIILNKMAIETLEELKKHKIHGNPYVFPGKNPNAHLITPRKTFANVCRMAGLDDLNLHSLRHSFASFLASGDRNVSLYTISKLLGHRTVAMSARYSHLTSASLMNASESVAAQLEEATR